MTLRRLLTLAGLTEAIYRDEDEERERQERLADPEVQALNALLDEWGEGWSGRRWNTPALHQEMLALADVARGWTDMHGDTELYRAFIPTTEQLADLRANGRFTIETDQSRPLASWSRTEEGALDWITGFDRPWVVFEKPVGSLSIYIDFIEASYDLNGHRPRYDEVIVRMPPTMVVTAREIVRENGVSERE